MDTYSRMVCTITTLLVRPFDFEKRMPTEQWKDTEGLRAEVNGTRGQVMRVVDRACDARVNDPIV